MSAMHETTLFEPSASQARRQAYNAAFGQLDLSWHWDEATYEQLCGGGRQPVRSFLEQQHPHLLRAYDADFLVSAIERTRQRLEAELRTNP